MRRPGIHLSGRLFILAPMKPYLLAALLSAVTLSALSQKDSTMASKPEDEPEGRFHWHPMDVIPLTDSIALYHISIHDGEEGIALVSASGNLVGQEIDLHKALLDVAVFHGKALAF